MTTLKGKVLPDTEMAIEAKIDDIDSKLGPGMRLNIGKDYSEQVQVDDDAYFVVSVVDTETGAIAAADITAGLNDIKRIRAGVTTDIVTDDPNDKDDGRIYTNYNFASTSWEIGDMFIVTFKNVSVVIDTQTFNVKNINFVGRITREGDIEDKVDTAILDIDAVQTTSDGIQTDVTAIDGKADTISSNVGDKGVGDDLHTKSDTTITDVGTVNGKVDSVQTDVTAIDTKVDTISADVGDKGVGDDLHTKSDTTLSDLSTIDTKIDTINDKGISATDGATDYVNATGGEQDIVAYTPPDNEKINIIKLTLSALTQSGTYKVYVDNEENISDTWEHGVDNEHLFIAINMIFNEEIKVSWEPATAEGADRNISWSVRVEK